MKIEQVAIQLYTLRESCKTVEDYATTLKRVREIGYQAIQISGVGAIPVGELRSIAEGEGLVIAATHEPCTSILETPEAVAERLEALGCRHTACPNVPGVDFSNLEAVNTFISRLDRAGAVLREAGKVLSFHNHSTEFYRLEGKTILDRIYEGTRPENVQGEPDTYWVQAGGGDSAAWCRKLAGRLPLLHIKDYAVDLERKPYYAEIGYGNLDFKAIIAEADAAGCEWYIVEQDTCPGDPFVSVKMSFDYIAANLVS